MNDEQGSPPGAGSMPISPPGDLGRSAASAGPGAAPLDPAPARPRRPEPPRVNVPVFLISGAGILAIALWAILAPDSAEGTLGLLVTTIAENLGWFYILTATIAVLFMIWIAVGRSGTVKLGPDHATPQFRLFSWASMLFAAGIGVDLLFFSVAEPVTQFYAPPTGDPETVAAARRAVVLTLFHYGVTGWALYALMGMAFGYFAYRFNMPLAIRSALYPILGRRIHGPAGDAVDIAAMLGTVFGVATSLGIGVVQLNYGLKVLFGVEEGLTAQIALVALAVGVATISAVSGVDKGIRRLSEANVGLAICLMIYILVTGRTAFLFDALVMNIGEYVAAFPGMTMDTYAFSDVQEWLNAWTLFFWAWWIAWAPFVGLFLARISRGRTLRQFVVGTLTIPFLFVLLWVSVFGNSALTLVMGGDDEFGRTAMEMPERAFYLLLEQYPGATAVMAVASLIGLLLYITSADSAALVMSNFTSRITDTASDGRAWSRIFWAVTVGVLTIAMLFVGGIVTLQNATIVMGLPFSIVIYLVMYSLFTSLRLELVEGESRRQALPRAMSSRSGGGAAGMGWRRRLQRAMTLPSRAQTERYMRETVRPALGSVAAELRERGADAVLESCPVPVHGGSIDQLDLRVDFGAERDFRYQVYPTEQLQPSFAGCVHLDSDADEYYYRLEVHSLTGSLGYDIHGYTAGQLIDDVLDAYERHLEFLHMQRNLPGASDVSDDADPVIRWQDDYDGPGDATPPAPADPTPIPDDPAKEPPRP